MNGYSKIGTATTHKPRSIDFSDFYSFPNQQEQEQPNNQVPVPEAAEREREDEGGNGERFGVILGRSGSVSNSPSGFQRAFSMRRSSSVSERYCRIHDQYMAIDEGTGRSMKKKKLRGGNIFKACKRLLGL